MKKILLWVCIALLILNGCHSNEIESSNTGAEDSSYANTENYKVMVVGCSDSSIATDWNVEYTFADIEKYENIALPNSVEKEVNNQLHKGVYLYANYLGYNFFPTYNYKTEDKFPFSLDDNGLLVSFFWGNANPYGKQKTQEECITVAKDFLSTIIDIQDYTMEVTANDQKEMYTIKFTKYLNTYKTADYASILVRYDGELYSYSSFMLGRVTASAEDSNIDDKALHSAIKSRLDAEYEKKHDIYDRVEYEFGDITITTLKDGTTAYGCYVDVNCYQAAGAYDIHYGEKIWFILQ